MIKNGQSAAKHLSKLFSLYDESSTTIPWEGSTLYNEVETVDNKFYNFLKRPFPTFSCIYGIYNVKSDKIYVGSCINLHARLIRHYYYLTHNIHHSKKLQRSWDKHGEDSFIIIILKNTDNLSKKELFNLEQYYIDLYNSSITGYNILKTVKFAKSFKLTEEQIEKRVSQSRIPVVCLTLDGKFYCEYNSISEAARAVNDQSTNISSCCKGKLNFVKDFIFIYKKDYNNKLNYAYKRKPPVFTEESRKKLSIALSGRKQTKEHRDKLRMVQGTWVDKYDIDNNFVKRYYSISSCCEDNNIKDHKKLKRRIALQTPLDSFYYKFVKDIV